MATWETTSVVTNGAVWANGNLAANSTQSVVKITDGKSSETTLKAGEAVTTTSANGDMSSNWVFKGTLTVDGVTYPVLSHVSGTALIAIGLPKDTPGIPTTLSVSDLNTGDFTVCFFPGTLIATPSGERKVEELVSGDLVLIGNSRAIPTTWIARMREQIHQRLGFTRVVSVKWIGRQTVSTRFGPAERLMPVRFDAGSLGGWGGNLFCRIAI